MGVEAEKKNEYSSDRLRERKNPHREDAILEGGRSNKQLAVYTKSTVSLEMVDTVFLNCGQGESGLCETLQSETIKNVQQHGQSKGVNGRKGCGKRQGKRMWRGSGIHIYKDLLSRPASDCLWFSMALPHSTSLV